MNLNSYMNSRGYEIQGMRKTLTKVVNFIGVDGIHHEVHHEIHHEIHHEFLKSS